MVSYWLFPTPTGISKLDSSALDTPLAKNERPMNQNSEMDDDLRPEYDFSQMSIVARGPGRKQPQVTVRLDPDVAALFPDEASVNEALRLMVRMMQVNPPTPVTAVSQ
jgi:hypothetical protein